MLVTIFFDLIRAVALGIIISVVIFVAQMSKSVIRRIYFGSKVHSKKKRLQTLTVGTLFGKIALLDGKSRSAGVEACESLICFELTLSNFERLKDDYPRLAMDIFGIITKNTNTALRNATNMIAELEK